MPKYRRCFFAWSLAIWSSLGLLPADLARPAAALVKEFSSAEVAEALATGYSYSDKPQALIEQSIFTPARPAENIGAEYSIGTENMAVKKNGFTVRVVSPYAGLSLEAGRQGQGLKEVDPAFVDNLTKDPKLTFYVYSDGPVTSFAATVPGDYVDIVRYPVLADPNGWETQLIGWLDPQPQGFRTAFTLPLTGLNPTDKLILDVQTETQEETVTVNLADLK